MATHTPVWNLIKPDVNDPYDIEDFNDNADILENALNELLNKHIWKYVTPQDYNNLSDLEPGLYAIDGQDIYDFADSPSTMDFDPAGQDYHIMVFSPYPSGISQSTWGAVVYTDMNEMYIFKRYLNGASVEVEKCLTKDDLTAINSAIASLNGDISTINGTLLTKEDKLVEVSGSTATVTVTLADGKKYTYTNVSTLHMTLGIASNTVSCVGTVKFSSQQPSVTLTGFTYNEGDDITQAQPSELWEFNILNGRCLWKNWGA